MLCPDCDNVKHPWRSLLFRSLLCVRIKRDGDQGMRRRGGLAMLGAERRLQESADEGRAAGNSALRCRLAKLPFRQADDRCGHRRLERVRRRLWFAGGQRRHRAARRAGHRTAGLRPRADLYRTLLPHSASRRRCRRRGAGCHRERIARRQGQGAGGPLLRTARRQNSRPYPGLLVALRDLAHQSSQSLQAGDHQPRRCEGDRRRGPREGFYGAEDQYFYL